jgi:hypothetical protein
MDFQDTTEVSISINDNTKDEIIEEEDDDEVQEMSQSGAAIEDKNDYR